MAEDAAFFAMMLHFSSVSTMKNLFTLSIINPTWTVLGINPAYVVRS
jgi:hypothetical protein